jgi:isoquinoline 1-oxidoreductase beta subunit
VSLNRETGVIRVHKVWCAVDPGVAIQPRHIEGMMIVGITNGTGHALFEQINIVNGEVQEGNFDTYRVIRMSEAPEIEVAVVPESGWRHRSGWPAAGRASNRQRRGAPHWRRAAPALPFPT